MWVERLKKFSIKAALKAASASPPGHACIQGIEKGLSQFQRQGNNEHRPWRARAILSGLISFPAR